MTYQNAGFLQWCIFKKRKELYLVTKQQTMSILNPKGKKGDKKNNTAKNSNQASKFLNNKNATSKGSGGFAKKTMTGGSQRGS